MLLKQQTDAWLFTGFRKVFAILETTTTLYTVLSNNRRYNNNVKMQYKNDYYSQCFLLEFGHTLLLETQVCPNTQEPLRQMAVQLENWH